MAPIRLIVGKHMKDQTEDKEAIQIFSYNQSGIISMLYKNHIYGKQTKWLWYKIALSPTNVILIFNYSSCLSC